jgi:hypothetical protein
MKRHPHRLALLGVLALAAAGCTIPPKPIEFNKRLVDWNSELSKASVEFAKALQKPGNRGALQSAFDNMESTLKRVREEYDDFTYPVGSRSGEDLYDEYGEYLDAQGRILERYRTCMNLARTNPGDPRIQKLLGEIRNEEIKAFNVVKSAQSAFAKEHDLDLGGY